MPVEIPPPTDTIVTAGLPPGAHDLLTGLDQHTINAIEAIGLAVIILVVWKFVNWVQQQAARS